MHAHDEDSEFLVLLIDCGYLAGIGMKAKEVS